MSDTTKPDMEDDREQARDLLRILHPDGPLDSAEYRELLLRVGPMVGITREECETVLAAAQGAADLAQRVRLRNDEANKRFDAALFGSRDLEKQGRHEEARRLLQEFIESETVQFWRDLGQCELGRQKRMRVIAEREYGFVAAGAGPAGWVVLRIGAPEQEAPSGWVLPFEVLGPAQERIESRVHGVDAVQALHQGLQQIDATLRSLQERSGGRLTFFEKEGPGFE